MKERQDRFLEDVSTYKMESKKLEKMLVEKEKASSCAVCSRLGKDRELPEDREQLLGAEEQRSYFLIVTNDSERLLNYRRVAQTHPSCVPNIYD